MEVLARATSPDHLDDVYDLICWAGLRVTINAVLFDAFRRLVTVDLTTRRPAKDGEHLDRFTIGDARKVAVDAEDHWSAYEDLGYEVERHQWRLEGFPLLVVEIDAPTVDLTVLGRRG